MRGLQISEPVERRRESGADVKICGVTEPEHVIAAGLAGATYIGFVFVKRSPRAVTPERAAELAEALAQASVRPVGLVGLFVDPTDAELEAALAVAPILFIQLHGDETPERVAEIRHATERPIIKAVPIAEAADLGAIDAYEAAGAAILVDAKQPPGAELPGGGGEPFDWRLVADRRWRAPWMLAGGLTPENVAEAIAITGAPAVDVSSGVEATRGVKDPAKIRALLAAARNARRPAPTPRA